MYEKLEIHKNFKRPKAKKGIASTIEVIAVILALFISFSIFFPGGAYKSNWDNAYASLTSRDIMATLLATGNLHSYMYNDEEMTNFLENMFPETNLIFWYRLEGIKDSIVVACNCTNEQIQALQDWTKGVRLNDRDIEMSICPTSLTTSEAGCIKESDVLLIWGYRDLQPHEQLLSDYLVEDKGIVELMDFNSAPDAVQQNIFGINRGGFLGESEDVILEPYRTDQITYQVYKSFYNMPLAVFGAEQSTDLSQCEMEFRGTLTLNEQNMFWICNATYAYFDDSGDTIPDKGPISPGESFSLDGFYFELSYVDSEDKIRITFLETPNPYEFIDFAMPPLGEAIISGNNDNSRVFVRMSGGANTACGVVLNNVSASRTTWIADFTRNGVDEVGDDHRQLLLSSLVWASKKYVGTEDVPIFQKGFATSYITIKNIDMFEIQKYDIGVGYPY